MTVVFLASPGANFDLLSLSFQVPIRGLAAKVAAVAVNNSATASSIVRFVFIARFRTLSPISVNPNTVESKHASYVSCSFKEFQIRPLNAVEHIRRLALSVGRSAFAGFSSPVRVFKLTDNG